MKASCKASNKRGEPCGATVVNADGFCSAHSGQNMQETGSRGGRRPAGSKLLRKALGKDDPLREKARDELEQLLDDPNPQVRLRAASSLFGYGVDKPDSERRKKGWDNKTMAGVPTSELFAQMKEISKGMAGEPNPTPEELGHYDPETGISILPSPGEIMAEYDREHGDDETP